MKKSVLTALAIAAFGLQAMAQGSAFWTPQSTGFLSPGRFLRDLDITSTTNAWAVAEDISSTTAPAIQEFTRTTNGGTTWTAGTITNADAAGFAFSNISAVDANTAWVAMFHETNQNLGRIYKTTDGGVTWTRQAPTAFTATSSFLNIVHMFDANNGWAQGDPVNGEFEMYTTTNGGTTWTQVPAANIPNPLSANEFGTTDIYTTVGTNVIYFGTNAGRVFKSTDAGLTWTVTGNTTLSAIEDIAFKDVNNGLIRQDGDLMRTTNGGTTWTQVNYGGTGSLYQFDLKYVPGTGNTYVSTGIASASSGSSYSVDGGTTWVDYDNGVLRGVVDFLNPTTGFAGGFNSPTGGDGVFKFNGTVINGINNSEFSKAVSVYPNPSNGVFAIEMPTTTDKVAVITVADALGRVVYNKTEKLNGAYNGQINLSNLGKGVYMLNIKTGENISMRKLVIE